MLSRARLYTWSVVLSLGVLSTSALADHGDGTIVGAGSRPQAGDAPFTAQLLNGGFSSFPEVVRLNNGSGSCSGTFVSTRVIVTAGHCVGSGRTGTLQVRGLSGPLGNARCEKSPQALNTPLGAQSKGDLTAQCGGGPVCGGGGLGFDPGFPGGFPGGFDPSFPGGIPPVIPGDPGSGNPANPAVPGARPAPPANRPPGALTDDDIRHDVAVCVVDNPVPQSETACLDDGRSNPSLIAGFGLANQGDQIIDDDRQRSAPLTVRQGPPGILESNAADLRGGRNASSAPGDSGGFVGLRDDAGRLKLRAVISGGNAVIEVRDQNGRVRRILNPNNRGGSAFADLRSPSSLSFLRDFAQRNNVSICGLDSGSSNPSPSPSPATPPALAARPPAPVGDPRLASAGSLGLPVSFPGQFGGFGFPGQFGGFGFPGQFGGLGGFGFRNPGEFGVFTPGLGNNGLGGFGNFGNPFLQPRVVRLRNGRLAIVNSGGFGGFGGFNRFGGLGGFGGFNRFGGLGGFNRFGGINNFGNGFAGVGFLDAFGAVPIESRAGLIGFGGFGGFNRFGGLRFSSRRR